MATPTMQTSIGLQANQFLGAMEKVVQGFGAEATAIENVVKTGEKFNAQGKVIEATLRAQVAGIGTVIAKYKELSKAQIEAGEKAQIKGSEVNKRLKLQASTVVPTKEPLTPANVGIAQTAVGQIRQAFPIPDKASIDQITRYELALSKVSNMLTQAKVSGQRFNEIFTAVRTGGLAKLQLSGDEAKLANSLSQISRGFETAAEQAKKFGLSTENIFRIGQALIFKEILGQIYQALQQATLAAVDFQIKISEIRTLAQGPMQASFESWSQSIARVSNELGLPQIEVAKTAYEALSAQIVKGRDETEEFVRSAGKLARIGVSDIATAGKTLQSVFNAYGIGANRVTEVSAKLFKAVDLGNFTIDELGQNLGRVTGPAQALGISLDETLASLAVLSRTTNAPDAIVQLSNVMLKLQKATPETSAFLKTLGYESGQAAIQARGLPGVLKAISDAADGNVSVLAEFGGELRAIRGFIGLTGDNVLKFGEALDQIKNKSKEAFAGAEIIRGESPADKLIKDWTQVKNFFINDFGQSTLQSLTKAINVFDDLHKTIRVTASIVEKVITVFVTYKLTMAVANATTSITTKSIQGLGIELKNVHDQTTKTGKAVKGLEVGLKAIAAVVVFSTILDEIAQARREINGLNKDSQDYLDTMEEVKAAREGKTKTGESFGAQAFRENVLKESTNFASALDNLMRPVFEKHAKAVLETKQHLNVVKEESKQAALELGVAFKATTDSINNTIKGYADNITKANKAMDDTVKNILDVKESVQSIILDLKMDFADEAQKFELRKQEIIRLQDEVERLMTSGTDEDLAKAKQLANEVLQLRQQDIKARLDLQRQQEIDRRTAQGRGAGSRFPDNSPIIVNVEEEARTLKEWEQRLINLNERLRKVKGEEVADNEKLMAKEKERERLLEKRIQDFLKLSPTDADNVVKKEFRDPTGKFDANKFNAEIEKQMKGIMELLSKEEKQKLGVIELEKFKLSLLKQQKAEMEAQRAIDEQAKAGQQTEKAKQDFEKAAQAREAASQQIETVGKKLDASRELVNKILQSTKGDTFSTTGLDKKGIIGTAQRNADQVILAISEGMDKAVKQIGFEPLAVDQKGKIAQREDTIKAKEEVQRLQDKLNAARDRLLERDPVTGKITAKPEDAEKLKGIAAELAMALEHLMSKFLPAGVTFDQIRNSAPTTGGASPGEISKQIKNQAAAAAEAFVKSTAAEEQQQKLYEQLTKTFGPMALIQAKVAEASQNNTAAIIRNTEAVNKLLGFFTNQAPIPIPANVPPATPQGNAFQAPGKHHGGLISGPTGYDNILIRAEAGEFVVNQAMTRKWLPQLIAMNQGLHPKIPGRFHEGGIVQTNVGDVNVTISGPVSPQQNIRQVGQAMRREIRRGNLDLPYKRKT